MKQSINKQVFKPLFVLLLGVLSVNTIFAQTTLFSESFDEANAATSGTDNSGNNIPWTATCTGCVAGDFFEVDTYMSLVGLRGNDTNGPATFSATGIDASSCYLITLAFDYASTGYTGTGNNECASECSGCTGDPADAVSNGGCNNCWDFLSWGVNFGASDNGSVVLGIDCNAPATGSITSEPACAPYDASGNLMAGDDPSNISIDITMAMWAGTENMIIDDIMVLCYTEAEATTAGLVAPAGCNPPPPAVCTIENVTVDSDGACTGNGNDASYTICFDAAGGSGDYDVVDTGNGNAVLGSVTGLDPIATDECVTITVASTAVSTLSIDVVDNADGTCTGGTPVTVNLPNCTPPCAITNVTLMTDGVCTGTDVTYTVCADVVNGSGDYDAIDVSNGNAVVGALAGQADGNICFNLTEVGPTPATTLMINVQDNQDIACVGASPVMVAIPECPLPCTITNVTVATIATCNGDDANYTVCADVANGSGNYDLVDTDNGNAVLSALTGQVDGNICFNVTIIGPTGANTLNVNVIDNVDNTCSGAGPVAVNIPTCCVKVANAGQY